jgi:hypothetical protein
LLSRNGWIEYSTPWGRIPRSDVIEGDEKAEMLMSTSSAVLQGQPSTRIRLSRWVYHAALAAVTLALVGCGNRAEDSRQQMHKLQGAIMEYEVNHGGKWPERLDQIKEEVGGEAAFNKLMKNPLTGDDPGYEYVQPKGKRGDADFDSQQVILYQLRGGKRDTRLKVGYLDGAVRPLETK